ncbi:MAG: ABC transporter permease subunit [Xanthobacteraceae bacterium]
MSFIGIIGWIISGLNVTLLVLLYTAIVAFCFAFPLGIAEYFLRGWARTIVSGFIDIWRGSSVVLLLFFLYYVLPAAGLYLNAYAVSAIAIGFNIGAYGSQALRSSLESIPRGQIEAGLSLGLHRSRVLLLIELPQACRKMIPIIGNEIIAIIKTSANVSLIGLADMTFRAKEIMQTTYQPAQIYSGLLLVYLMICLPIALVVRKLARNERVR